MPLRSRPHGRAALCGFTIRASGVRVVRLSYYAVRDASVLAFLRSRCLYPLALLAGVYMVHPISCFAGTDFLTQASSSQPLTFSSKRGAELEEREAILVKTLDGQKTAGKLRLASDPVYQNKFDGCNFRREEKVTYYGQSFGGSNQATTSETEISFNVTTLTKIESSFDPGPPETFSVIFVSDTTSIDTKVEGAVFHHFDQLIAVDDAKTAQSIVDAFNYIVSSCKARQSPGRK
jgi:hypothetical protein